MTDDDTEPMKLDCQRLLQSVSLQNNVLTEGRGPGRMPLWTRKVYTINNFFYYTDFYFILKLK